MNPSSRKESKANGQLQSQFHLLPRRETGKQMKVHGAPKLPWFALFIMAAPYCNDFGMCLCP